MRRDGSERVPYNFPDMPVYIGNGYLSAYRNMEVACHWHDDWECICVVEGDMGYFVNGEHMILREGQAVFVNSRCMHYNYAVDGRDARYICLLLHPNVFDRHELIRERYVEPLRASRSMGYRVMDRSSAVPMLAAMREIMQSVVSGDPAMGLTLMHCGYQIVERLYRDMSALPALAAAGEPRLEALHGMIGYVQSHYSENIALADIAAAGNVSKSSCCSIFRQYLQQTPVNYLTGYRLERSSELLRSTNLSVTEIAMRTGFSSQSYFAEIFRKHCGATPTEYRRQHSAVPQETGTGGR